MNLSTISTFLVVFINFKYSVLMIFVLLLIVYRFVKNSIRYAKAYWIWVSTRWSNIMDTWWKWLNQLCHDAKVNAGGFRSSPMPIWCINWFSCIYHFVYRNHPLAKHSDVLTCIETRISMLSMTYTKYIEVNLCCFIPGKVSVFIFVWCFWHLFDFYFSVCLCLVLQGDWWGFACSMHNCTTTIQI